MAFRNVSISFICFTIILYVSRQISMPWRNLLLPYSDYLYFHNYTDTYRLRENLILAKKQTNTQINLQLTLSHIAPTTLFISDDDTICKWFPYPYISGCSMRMCDARVILLPAWNSPYQEQYKRAEDPDGRVSIYITDTIPPSSLKKSVLLQHGIQDEVSYLAETKKLR
jgi:hypothetical protein